MASASVSHTTDKLLIRCLLYYMPGLTLSKWQISLGLNDLAAAECMSFVYVHPASQDQAYFAKVFKQKYHLSPSEYRFKNKP